MNLNRTKTLPRFFSLLVLALASHTAFSQAKLTVTVTDADNQGPLPGATVVLLGTSPLIGAATDLEGRAVLTAPAGSYNIQISSVGYGQQVRSNVVLTTGNVQTIAVELAPAANETETVEVVYNRQRSAAVASAITPLSIQKLTTEEIKSNPGGNFDVSRVVQALPGVSGSTASGARNDIVIRGGGPNENVYYLDGIEIPVINHFQTQGSSGGPLGLLNVSFIEEVTLSSSAWAARYDNALASVFQFKQKDGNSERLQGNIRLSATELAATFDGPINKKTTFLASARRSYLQLLFQAIDLPIRPNYWDAQFKITHKLSDKYTLNFLGVGAIDEFSFGVPRKSTPENEYILRALPSINQHNYTIGSTLTKQMEGGFWRLSLSQNLFNNRLDRYEDGVVDESRRNLRIRSQELETKLRWELNQNLGNGYRLNLGAVVQDARFDNDLFLVFRRAVTDEAGNELSPAINLRSKANINFRRYGASGQLTRTWFGRLDATLGIRTDGNSFTNTGNELWRTLSPRAALSYALNDKWRLNASVGRYYKLPVYTVLAFKDEAGNFTNRGNEYIRSDHYVAGFEYLPSQSTRITAEVFTKRYNNYPVSRLTGISLANLGADFGAVGNEPVTSSGEGETYGFELFFQQKLVKNLFLTLSYTYVRSEFSGEDGVLRPSAWDYRHLVSAIFGYKFRRGWELGLKHRFAGGAPYTPFDLASSQRNYVATGQGVLDYAQLNTRRLPSFNQLDIRVDKKWNFNRFTLDVFVDVTNVLLFRNSELPNYTFQRTADGKAFVTTDGLALAADGSNGIPLILQNREALVTPTLGFIVEF